jgi:hypothetical protein
MGVEGMATNGDIQASLKKNQNKSSFCALAFTTTRWRSNNQSGNQRAVVTGSCYRSNSSAGTLATRMACLA